jgi:hypothetical protein
MRRSRRRFSFPVEKCYQRLNLIGLQRISEGRHTQAALPNLFFDLLLRQAFADGAQVRSVVGASRIRSVAVLTASLMKERRTGFDLVLRRGMHIRYRQLQQAARNSEDSQGNASGGTGFRQISGTSSHHFDVWSAVFGQAWLHHFLLLTYSTRVSRAIPW